MRAHGRFHFEFWAALAVVAVMGVPAFGQGRGRGGAAAGTNGFYRTVYVGARKGRGVIRLRIWGGVIRYNSFGGSR